MVVAVLLGVTVLAPTLQQFVAQRQRIADLEQHIATVEGQIAELAAEQARWSDPAYIEAQARGRLLFVKPGETTYLVTETGETAPPQHPVDVRPEMFETEADWLANMAQSFVSSGLANGAGETNGAGATEPPTNGTPEPTTGSTDDPIPGVTP